MNTRPLSIIKLGGAAITDGRGPNGLDLAVAGRLSAEISRAHAQSNIILVHGTGSVGKPPAREFGFVESGILGKDHALVACDIHRRIRSLNQQLVEVLLNARVPAVGVDPAIILSADFQGLRNNDAQSFLTDLVRQGVIPVLYGDLVPQSNGDFRVLSSDGIACVLASNLQAQNLIFLSNVPGVFASADHEENSPVLNEINERDIERPDLFGASDAVDVSGGMRAKMKMALAAGRHCPTCWLGSGRVPDVLTRFFQNGVISGTRIREKA